MVYDEAGEAPELGAAAVRLADLKPGSQALFEKQFGTGTNVLAFYDERLGLYVVRDTVNLNASQSALANPVPYTPISSCLTCQDNYNHYNGSSFPSRN